VSTVDEDPELLLKKLAQREQGAKRRAVLLTLLPACLGLAVLASAWMMARHEQAAADQARDAAVKADAEAEQAKAELTQAKTDLAKTQDLYAVAQNQLHQATDMARASHAINPDDLKAIIVRNPPPAENILEAILESRDVAKWNLYGNSPEEGFNSPNFANYILKRSGISAPSLEGGETTDTPRPGDLAFYPGGTVMFYFRDANDQPFVIGMTPLGVLSLNPDFAKADRYAHLPHE
jgi:hypothetical protein